MSFLVVTQLIFKKLLVLIKIYPFIPRLMILKYLILPLHFIDLKINYMISGKMQSNLTRLLKVNLTDPNYQ